MNSQLHIERATNAEDKARVEQILDSVCKYFALVDTTVTSRVPDTIRCYTEKIPGESVVFAFGARIVADLIVFDLSPGRNGVSSRFSAFERYLVSELQRIFGERLHVANESEFIKCEHSLPVSEASREFGRQQFKQWYERQLQGQ